VKTASLIFIFVSENYNIKDRKKTVDITFDKHDLNGQSPRLMLEGWNAASKEIGIE